MFITAKHLVVKKTMLRRSQLEGAVLFEGVINPLITVVLNLGYGKLMLMKSSISSKLMLNFVPRGTAEQEQNIF
jgi:hypothetical protein